MTNESRYRTALERIANLSHDEACDSSAPLMECGCFEKSPHELAQMALDGIDWNPAPRKQRALVNFNCGFDINTDPWFLCMQMCHASLSQLSEEDFAGRSLLTHDLIRMAVSKMSEQERKRFAELNNEIGEFSMFSDVI